MSPISASSSSAVRGFMIRPLLLRRPLMGTFSPRLFFPSSTVGCSARFVGPLEPTRRFIRVAATKVAKTLGSEVKHEEEQYQQAKEIKRFIKNTSFELSETEGDVNMTLRKEVDGGRVVLIEWQLTSPFDPSADVDGNAEDHPLDQEATDFCITIENKDQSGVSFYCSTKTGEDHRYVVGSVKAFFNGGEQKSPRAYNGPEFEDLDEKLQEALDEYLAECGVSNEVCDFIDAYALDKEQREYISWLKKAKAFLEA